MRAMLVRVAVLVTASSSAAAAVGNGNFDPAFVPVAADYISVDLNSPSNGSGRSAADPNNKLPEMIGNGRQLLFKLG